MKVRICFGKTGAGRYLSHLDVARTMERSLRRAKAPIAFSEGFNPHPKIAFASALAVGTTGCKEYLDVELASAVDVAAFGKSLESAFSPALTFVAAKEIDAGSKSLSAVVNLAIYEIRVCIYVGDKEKVVAGITEVLAAKELWRKPKEKPGKKPVPAKEVRRLVRKICILGADDEASRLTEVLPAGQVAVGRHTLFVEMELGMEAGGQLRPQELWEMIGAAGGFDPEPPEAVCRTALLIYKDGKAFSPMEGVSV